MIFLRKIRYWLCGLFKRKKKPLEWEAIDGFEGVLTTSSTEHAPFPDDGTGHGWDSFEGIEGIDGFDPSDDFPTFQRRWISGEPPPFVEASYEDLAVTYSEGALIDLGSEENPTKIPKEVD